MTTIASPQKTFTPRDDCGIIGIFSSRAWWGVQCAALLLSVVTTDGSTSREQRQWSSNRRLSLVAYMWGDARRAHGGAEQWGAAHCYPQHDEQSGDRPRPHQWVQTAFQITEAVLIPAVGWLAARLGTKWLFLLSTLPFITGSALSGMAWDVYSLIAFRVLQGIGVAPSTRCA